jgi:hypothetical protein
LRSIWNLACLREAASAKAGAWNLEFHNNQVQDELKFKTGAR